MDKNENPKIKSDVKTVNYKVSSKDSVYDLDFKDIRSTKSKPNSIFNNIKMFFGVRKKSDVKFMNVNPLVSNITPVNDEKTMWVPDEKAMTCYNCQKTFNTIFLRKHHCRICGNVFCEKCSSKNVEGKYWGSQKQIKVCDYCFEMYNKLHVDNLVEFNSESNSTPKDNPLEDTNEDEIDLSENTMNNLKRETKLSEYCKKAEQEREDNLRFLRLNIESEKENLKNLNTYSEILIRSIIEQILKSEGLMEKWLKLVYYLTMKTINNVSPTFQDLKDSLNINDYVKIKLIDYKDSSLSRFIDGYAMNKNVCSKKMNTNIKDPKILLLDCGLDYSRNSGLVNFDSNILQQEPAYLDIIMKKINLVDPNVILVNKAVSRKIQEKLSDKISLVISVKSNSLKRIARCTKSYVLPSTDLIDSQTILGRCKCFRIEKIKQNNINKNILHVNDTNLMIFEGCNALLGCTLIFSGPERAELKKIKSLMRIILLTARDIYLQKHLLYFMFYKIPTDLYDPEKFEKEIKNRFFKYYNTCFYKTKEDQNNLLPQNSIFLNKIDYDQNHIQDFICGFDTSIIFNNKLPFDVTRLTMAIGNSNINMEKFWGYNMDKKITGASMSKEDLNEPEILKMINCICAEAQNLELAYYSDEVDKDKPFGKLIIDLCNEKEVKCKECQKFKSNHIYYIYKNAGRISVQMVQNNEDFLESISEYIKCTTNFNKKISDIYSNDIFSYGVCRICKLIVTPLVKLPREMFNLSFTKFIKILLYNHSVKNRSNDQEFNILKYFPNIISNSCCHYLFKDVYRIYHTPLGSIKLAYEESPIYSIESTPLKEDNSNYNTAMNEFLENQIKIAKIKGKAAIETLKQFLKNLLEELNDSILPNIGDDMKMKDIFKKVSAITISQHEKLHEISILIGVCFDKQAKFDHLFKLIATKKNIFGRIFQIKLIYHNLRRCVKKLRKSIVPPKEKIYINDDNHSISSKPSSFSENNQDKIIDKEISIIDLIKEINFNDEFHSKISNNVNIDDISSIISYTLMSDKYQEFISAHNKFKLLSLKCEIKSREYELHRSETISSNNKSIASGIAINSNLRFSELKKSNSSTKENPISYNKIESSLEKIISDEDVSETSLLFEPKRNSYSNYQKVEKIDDHKINQLLETELLSDEKNNFILTFNNNNSYLSNNCLNLDITRKIKIKDDDKNPLSNGNEHDDKPVYKEDKISFPNENMKSLLDEIDSIRKEIVTNKDSNKTKGRNSNEYRATEEDIEIEVITYFPRQFEALRATYCATYEEFILSLATSFGWSNVTGGKSKAEFFKTFDNRYILKGINKHEFKMFVETGFQYFHHKAKFLFHKMPSSLAKILGAYKIKIKHKQNKIENYYIFLMENLFYDLDAKKNLKSYDLKGSKLRRYVAKRDHTTNQVLPDTNFKEDFKGEPIPLEKNIYELMKAAVHNDSLILSKMNVVDYSLLLIIDSKESEENSTNQNKTIKSIRIGIIDYCRKFTWDKQLEHVGKMIINKFQVPTIVNPIIYKDRFKDAICSYFIGL